MLIVRRGNPKLSSTYIATGKWQDDDKLVARVENELSTLEELNIFRTLPIFEPVDAKRLQQLFSQAQNTLSKQFYLLKSYFAPMAEVKESYLGYLPASVI
jgi:hypothetical protein